MKSIEILQQAIKMYPIGTKCQSATSNKETILIKKTPEIFDEDTGSIHSPGFAGLLYFRGEWAKIWDGNKWITPQLNINYEIY